MITIFGDRVSQPVEGSRSSNVYAVYLTSGKPPSNMNFKVDGIVLFVLRMLCLIVFSACVD